MKLLLFILLLMQPIPEDQLIAIRNYKELQLRCVPKTLQDSTIRVNYKDSTYTMKPDLNGIVWVTEKPTAN